MCHKLPECIDKTEISTKNCWFIYLFFLSINVLNTCGVAIIIEFTIFHKYRFSILKPLMVISQYTYIGALQSLMNNVE